MRICKIYKLRSKSTTTTNTNAKKKKQRRANNITKSTQQSEEYILKKKNGATGKEHTNKIGPIRIDILHLDYLVVGFYDIFRLDSICSTKKIVMRKNML